VWDIRNTGIIPAGALPRVRAFAEAAESAAQDHPGPNDDEAVQR
jgi:hypothetical protein